MKKLCFSLTAKDFEWQYFRGPGNGGQKKNKTSSACRCVHSPSGARGESSESRSQLQNKQMAFKRMGNSIAFKRWVYGKIADIERGESLEKFVDKQMSPENLQFEIRKDDKWQIVKENEIEKETE